MNKTVSKTFQAVDFIEQDGAQYEAIKLSAAEAESVLQPTLKPAQQ